MVYGEVFEFGLWPFNVMDAGVAGEVTLAPQVFHNHDGIQVSVTSGAGFAGLANRGFKNQGLFLEAGKPYEGYFFALAESAVVLEVQLRDYVSGTVLASTTPAFIPGPGFQRVNFSLTPSAETSCIGIVPGSDPNIDCGKMGSEPGHVCVKCAGEIAFGVQGKGAAVLAYFWLQPGAWGQYKGLPVQASTANVLLDMGVTAIRQGGTFTKGEPFLWKNWRGPVWTRPSVGAEWGSSLISSWGPFEMIDFCEAAGIQPIITTSKLGQTQDFVDLVE